MTTISKQSRITVSMNTTLRSVDDPLCFSGISLAKITVELFDILD
jgi:hypothetical protein